VISQECVIEPDAVGAVAEVVVASGAGADVVAAAAVFAAVFAVAVAEVVAPPAAVESAARSSMVTGAPAEAVPTGDAAAARNTAMASSCPVSSSQIAIVQGYRPPQTLRFAGRARDSRTRGPLHVEIQIHVDIKVHVDILDISTYRFHVDIQDKRLSMSVPGWPARFCVGDCRCFVVISALFWLLRQLNWRDRQ
jgi:hypothetical protein